MLPPRRHTPWPSALGPFKQNIILMTNHYVAKTKSAKHSAVHSVCRVHTETERHSERRMNKRNYTAKITMINEKIIMYV